MKLTFGTLLTILWAFSYVRAKAVGEYLKMLKSESFKCVSNFKKCKKKYYLVYFIVICTKNYNRKSSLENVQNLNSIII